MCSLEKSTSSVVYCGVYEEMQCCGNVWGVLGQSCRFDPRLRAQVLLLTPSESLTRGEMPSMDRLAPGFPVICDVSGVRGFRTDSFVQRSRLIFSHTPAELLSCPAVSMLETSLMCVLWSRRWRINRSLCSKSLLNDLQLCFVSNQACVFRPL